MTLIVEQIVHGDPMHIALAEIDRLALRQKNIPILREIIAEEAAGKNRPDLIKRAAHHLERLTK